MRTGFPETRRKIHFMKSRLAFSSLFLTFLIVPHAASARTWRVSTGGGPADAPTIQSAIDSAAVGDTVLVGPGTYLENLRIVAKDIVLKSEQGFYATTLDGSGQSESVIYLSGQSQAAVFEGFTITGGTGHVRGSSIDGGGAFFDNGSSAIVQNNYFVDNGQIPTTVYGGAVAVNSVVASPLLRNNIFENNQAKLGGAIASGVLMAEDNTFVHNTCQFDGGAIYAVFNTGFTRIERNRFIENTAGDHSGGTYIGGKVEAEVRIVGNLFIRNHADGSTHDYLAGGSLFVSKVHGLVANNTLVETVGPTWFNGAGGALSLRDVPSALNIDANIFAFNDCPGITCRYGTQNATLGANLFWMNAWSDLGYYPAICPSSWAAGQTYADPLFCGQQIDNFTVSSNSPALTGPVAMGYSATPGCGQTGVAVRRSSWGLLKTRF